MELLADDKVGHRRWLKVTHRDGEVAFEIKRIDPDSLRQEDDD